MKRALQILVLMCTVACSNPNQPVFETGLEGTEMPDFNLLLIDSITKFNTHEITNKKSVVLFCFSPFCPYCRAQTTAILANINSLPDIQFCLLTNAPFTEFRKFYKEYNLGQYPNIIAGIDINNQFGAYFKVTGVPYTAIYNQHKILKQVIIGQTKINDIKNLSLE